MTKYIDTNSGRAPQPGAIVYNRFAPVIEQADEPMVDVAVADEVTEQDEAAAAPKPRRKRRTSAS